MSRAFTKMIRCSFLADMIAMMVIVGQSRSTMWNVPSKIGQIIALPLRFGPHLRVNPRLKPNGLVFFFTPPHPPPHPGGGGGMSNTCENTITSGRRKKGQQTWIKRIRAFLLHGAHYPEQMGFRESFSSSSSSPGGTLLATLIATFSNWCNGGISFSLQ